VRQAYDAFHFFNGRMATVVEKRDPDVLRACLTHYLTPFVADLNLERTNLFDALHGIQFLPVEKNVYLSIQAFVNGTEQSFPAVEETAILYHEHLVWSGFDQAATRALYALHVRRLRVAEPDAGATPFSMLDVAELDEPNAVDADDGSCGGAAPLVRGLGDRRLYVWQSNGVYCVWLMRRVAGLRQLCEQLRQFAEPHTSAVAPLLAQQHTTAYAAPATALSGSSLQPHRYIYFNHMNLALKTSLRARGRTFTPQVMRAMCDMHADFAKQSNGELMVKTSDDIWLVGRKADHREFVVVFDRVKSSAANLIEVHDEVRRLSNTFFASIFLTDPN
jgi:hypothetical protein